MSTRAIETCPDVCILTRVIAASVEQTIHIISPEGMANTNNNNNNNKYHYDDNDNDKIAMHTKWNEISEAHRKASALILNYTLRH